MVRLPQANRVDFPAPLLSAPKMRYMRLGSEWIPFATARLWFLARAPVDDVGGYHVVAQLRS